MQKPTVTFNPEEFLGPQEQQPGAPTPTPVAPPIAAPVASAPVPTPASKPNPAHRTPRPNLLPHVAALGTRLAGGLISGTVGAVPSPVTTPAAAAIAGAGEYLAQNMESADPVDYKGVGIESAIGAVPFGKLIKAVKPGISVAKQAIANAARMGGFIEASNMARRYHNQGEILPQSGQEAVFDALTSGVGALSGLSAARGNFPPSNNLGVADDALEKAIAENVVPSKEPVLVPTSKMKNASARPGGGITATEAAIKQGKEVEPTITTPTANTRGGLRVGPGQPVSKITKREVGASNADYAKPGPIKSIEVEHPGRTVEGAAPEAPAVTQVKGEVARTPSRIDPEKLDSDGIARRPDAYKQGVDEAIANANKISEAQLKVNQSAKATETKQAAAEQRADLENTRQTGGATLAQRKATENKALEQRAGEIQKREATQQSANEMLDKEIKEARAKAEIAGLIDSGDLEPRVSVSEVSEAVPTRTGSARKRTTYSEKPPAKEEMPQETRPINPKPAGTPPPAPKPAAPAAPKAAAPVDPKTVLQTIYATENEALTALGQLGKKGTAVSRGKKKGWTIKLDEAAPAAPKAAAPIKPVQKAPEAPVAAPKAPVAPPAPKAPVEAPKAVPEAPVAPAANLTPAELEEAANFGKVPPKVKAPEITEAPPTKAAAPVKAKPPVAPKQRKGEIDAVTRDDVQKWTPDEIKQAQAKYPKDKRLQTILSDEVKRRGEAPPEPPPAAPVPTKPSGPAPKPVAPVATKAPKGKPMKGDPLEPAGMVDKQVDLKGAADAAEVKRRVINELTAYKKEVDAAREMQGVNEKGQTTGELPRPRTIEVPGQDGSKTIIRVGPDQVDNLIQRFESGLGAEKYGGGNYHGNINPNDAWRGIVDKGEPRPNSVRISTGYGQGFASKEGNAPGYKLPFAAKQEGPAAKPAAPFEGSTAKPKVRGNKPLPASAAAEKVAQGKVQAAKQAEIQPAAQGTPTTKDGQTKAQLLQKHGLDPNMSTEDLALETQAAADRYFALKEQAKSDATLNGAVRMAGEQYGNLRAASALAAKESGTQIKPVVEPVVPKVPKGKGPTSDDLMRMAPEQQEAELTKAIKAFKQSPEKGAALNQLMVHLGSGAAGAAIGAQTTPDDPITGAIIGGSAGMFAPSVMRALIRHVNGLPPGAVQDRSRAELERYIGDKLTIIKETIPDLYRSFLLSKPDNLVINAFFGPFGSGMTYSLERALAGDIRGWRAMREFAHPFKLGKEWGTSRAEARSRLVNSNERADMLGVAGPEWFKRSIEFPAEAMTAGDVATRNILMRNGFSELEARTATLTSEPFSAFFQGMGNWRKTKGPHGHHSFPLRMILPFYRTSANQVEQSLIRVPVLGYMLRAYTKQQQAPIRDQIAQGAISAGAFGIAYAVGKNSTKEQEARWHKLLSNFAGPYGLQASAGFIAGVAAKNGSSPTQQVSSVISQLPRDLPMPTTDSFKSVRQMYDDITSGKTPSLPYGVIPPWLSSKEQLSIPTLERAVAGEPEATRPTKSEYSIAAPFFPDKELKPKQPTAREHEMNIRKKQMRERRQYSTDRKEILKQRRQARRDARR